MEKGDIENGVIEVMEAIFGCTVNSESTFESVDGWDSLKHTQMIFALEDKYSVMFSEEMIPNQTSVSQIVSSIIELNES